MTPPEVPTVTGLPALAPSITNCTVPVGVPEPGAGTLMVAVNVTFWPDVAGLPEDANAVVVFALPTVCVTLRVLPAKLLSPP